MSAKKKTVRLALCLEYDGSGFSGWQTQKQGERTVQVVLQDAAERFFGVRPGVSAASRTDAGVHAEGQIAHLDAAASLPLHRIRDGINHFLPEDITIKRVWKKPPAFHSRYNASGKMYRYVVCDGSARPVLDRKACWWVPGRLDVAAMRRAASGLEGRHDFSAFCASGTSIQDKRRRLTQVRATRSRGRIIIQVRGESFLRHMVRILAGTLVAAGRGKITAKEVRKILTSKRRSEAGPTAPAWGLTLIKVYY